MGDSLKKNSYSSYDLQYGRKRIILDYDEVTSSNLEEIMEKAIGIHNANARDCDYLINYFLGDQDILNRAQSGANNINNKTVVNYAFPITREIVGYTFGNAVEFIQRDNKYQKEVKKLSDMYSYEFSYYIDICTAIYSSICGLAYQITLPSTKINKDATPDIPITYNYLDPRNTFIVQRNDISNSTLMSCHFTINSVTNKVDYTCYTDDYKFEFSDMDMSTLKITTNPIGLNPITMIENSLFLTGDWEEAIAVMNASNQIASDSLNDIEGTIKSLLVVIGAEFEDDASIDKVKNNRILTLTKPVNTGNTTSGTLDAKFIAPHLDSTSVANIRKYLEDARNVITGIPDRAGNSSGGDTGMAVLNRDGWTDVEIVARLKELFFKKAKKQQLAVGLRILQKLGLITKDLSVINIDLIIGRHSQDNLQTKTQAFSTLVATNKLATIDCLELSNLTNRTSEMVERGKKEQEENEKKALEQAQKTQGNTNTNQSVETSSNEPKNNE